MARVQIPTVVLLFFMIDLALGIAYIADYLAERPYPRLTAFLDLNQEGNLPAWYSSIQWFCVATALGIFAQRNFRLSQRKSWPLVVLPVIFLALSLDEVAQIHEWLGHKSDILLTGASRHNSLFNKTGIWMFVVGLPFFALFVGLMISIRAYFWRSPRALARIMAGMALMLGGAIGVETLSNFVAGNSLLDVMQVLAEEGCEMLGATSVLWGSFELLHRHGFSLRLNEAVADSPAGARNRAIYSGATADT